jgi:hypothetical protein
MGALRDQSAPQLLRLHMKLRRPAVRVEDERGNPVSFFQLQEMAKLEVAKISGPCQIIDLTDGEHAAVAAAIRRAIEEDRFPPHAAP